MQWLCTFERMNWKKWTKKSLAKKNTWFSSTHLFMCLVLWLNSFLFFFTFFYFRSVSLFSFFRIIHPAWFSRRGNVCVDSHHAPSHTPRFNGDNGYKIYFALYEPEVLVCILRSLFYIHYFIALFRFHKSNHRDSFRVSEQYNVVTPILYNKCVTCCRKCRNFWYINGYVSDNMRFWAIVWFQIQFTVHSFIFFFLLTRLAQLWALCLWETDINLMTLRFEVI